MQEATELAKQPAEQHSVASDKEWNVFGRRVPRSEIVFFAQILILYTVIVTSIYNLSRKDNEDKNLWTTLLSSSIGYLLPNPKIKKSWK